MDLAAYLAILRRRFPILLLCLAAGLAGGTYRGYYTTPVYQATARALVSQPATDRGVQDTLAAAQLSGTFVQTYAQVATSRSVAEKVVGQLGLSESPEAVQGRVSAQVETSTFLINIKAMDVDPVRAKALADAAAVALGARVDELQKDRPNPVRAQLLDRAPVPTVPTSPRPKSDLALGLVLALVAGVALVALLEALDRTIKTAAHGDVDFQTSMLGLVPRRRSGLALVVADDEGFTDSDVMDSEAYRALRTSMQFAQADDLLHTILVTSAAPGDGKTTTAANLALALAASGQKVALVDADLRRPKIADLFGLEGSVGLGSLVLREVELDDALQQWNERLAVLPAGRPLPPNPSEVLGSQSMRLILDSLSERVDVVVIDTPPVLPVTDAVVLATQVDAVVLVARYGKTGHSSAAEAGRRLAAVGANVVGYVLNDVPPRESSGYYADYRYAQAGSAKKRRKATSGPQAA